MASSSSLSRERTCLCNPTNNTNSNSSTSTTNLTKTVAGTTHSLSSTNLVAGTTNSTSNSTNSVAGSTNSTNSIAGSTSSGSISSNPGSSYSRQMSHGVKCKTCRSLQNLKPKFSFLRSQRSLDLCSGSPAREMSSKEAEARRREPLPRERRARSAERYEGMRVTDGTPVTVLPRQTSLQTPLVTSGGAPGPPLGPPTVGSPPPTYEAAVGKQGGLPPSYDEYITQRLTEKTRGVSGRETPPPPWTQPTQPSVHTCPCARCKSVAQARGGSRALRVSLPPEEASTAVSESTCPCSKCQPRYSSYGDTANVNTAVLISLDTTTAMHSVLADGIALCTVM